MKTRWFWLGKTTWSRNQSTNYTYIVGTLGYLALELTKIDKATTSTYMFAFSGVVEKSTLIRPTRTKSRWEDPEQSTCRHARRPEVWNGARRPMHRLAQSMANACKCTGMTQAGAQPTCRHVSAVQAGARHDMCMAQLTWCTGVVHATHFACPWTMLLAVHAFPSMLFMVPVIRHRPDGRKVMWWLMVYEHMAESW